ncbi:MAG: transglycosylase SLT domain-containing protein [Rhodoferax sp.]|nr:transglycosylase SLT domain-containing protein [Rhodoferax sp.]
MQFTKILTPSFSATLIASVLFTAIPCAQAQPGSDDALLQMSQAFKKGDKAALTALLPLARGNPLEAWAAYWELKARLDDASAQEVQDFLTRYAGTYQEDRLRNDWLLLLGQRRDWEGFAAEYPKFRMRDDREVQCYALQIEQLTSAAPSPTLADQVRKNWFALHKADDGCTLAAGTLIAAEKMPALDAWRKARLAMAANRLTIARNAVEIVAPEALNLVSDLGNSPAKFLASKGVAMSRVSKQLVVLALIRMAANDPDAAPTQLESTWSLQLSSEERNWVWGAIGKQAATRLGDGALDYYGHVSRDSDLTDDMLEWKVRAALRAGNWPVVLTAIKAMSEDARRNPAWVYWKARALLATLNGTQRADPASPRRLEANALLQGIAGPSGFYEQLALEDLGQRVTVPPRPAPLTAQEKQAALADPGLNRALYAIGLGLRSEGVREWNYSTNLHAPGGMSDRELLAAADLACQREIWDRCINTSERTKSFMDFTQRFPMPHEQAVIKRAREINIDPAYVYGLIRQESRFIIDARSGVGASGLMQVMPATARWTAKKIGLVNFSADQISDRDTNIAIGTGYLKLILDNFDGSMALAAAAYNAGPGRPRSWRNGPVLDAAIWAENVPFAETREYVKKVLANTTDYAAILSGQPQSLKARLGTVGPRDTSVPDPARDLP